jgi:hypothetical protein
MASSIVLMDQPSFMLTARNGGISTAKLHRTDGPAIIHVDGSQYWYIDNKLHRTDGPAFIHANGTQWWYINGKLHRTDGPAIIRADGTQEWYLYGKQMSPDFTKV